jgi:predicted extracellular nuclease
VRVGGRVAEYDAGAPGNAGTAAHTVTELHDASAPQVLGEACGVTPIEVALPLPPGEDLERLEGMLVTLRGPLTVQQNYFLGRFGQLSLAAGGRVQAPTNQVRPGPAARALAVDNARRAILLDDGSALQDPSPTPFLAADGTVRAGDTTDAVTGVLDYGLAGASPAGPAAWKIHPTQPVRFARANPRTGAPPAVGGTLRIAAANVDNFFSTIDDGTATCGPRHVAADCRGARSALEFDRQRTKLVEELVALDGDVVGLMEIENNGALALRSLVDALNARVGAATWALVDDPPEGAGTDAIKVALIYKPARVRPVGVAQSDRDPIHNRPPLAQTFETVVAAAPRTQPGARINVIVDHFKSRRCEGAQGLDLDQGDLQGCWNHRRVLQAQALRRFAAEVERRSGIADTLLIGDLNAYAREDPVTLLAEHGYVDQVDRFDASGYSYVYDGAAGRLDEVFASRSLSARVTGVAEWHVNADEPALLDYTLAFRAPACATCAPDRYSATPWRASDHDPVVIGLKLAH